MNTSYCASVVIPVFNQLESLKAVLRFFNYQSYGASRFEVVVVDDGSSEPVIEHIDRSCYEYALNIITQDNRGRAAARNRGVEYAQGDLLIFCDSDRLPDPDFVAAHIRFHQRNKGVAAFGPPLDCFYATDKLYVAQYKDIDVIRRFSRKPDYYQNVSKLFAPHKSASKLAWIAFLVGNSSIEKTGFEKAGGFDENFKTWGVEHFELGLRIQKARIDICHNPDAFNYHIPHGREAGYYRDNIQKSVKIMTEKHPDLKVDLLKAFLFGEISLQQFELAYGNEISEIIAAHEPVLNSRL
jgi:glycosyltransferase involved in cell wall biosynthesis